MNASQTSAPSIPPLHGMQAAAPVGRDEYEDVLGWECANPALQIEVWRREAAAQPADCSY